MAMAAVPPRRRVVVFDLGGVLLQWNPRFLYRKLFAGDEAAMERFLDEVCTEEWNERQDAGRSFADAVAELRPVHGDKLHLIEAWRQRFDEMIPGAIEGTVDDRERLEAARRAALRADELVVRDLSAAARALPVSVVVRRDRRIG